tara:strand:- start:6358 stop:7377 length:1020 start_codon:yes stop_codon:yes gene_type:complete
VAKDNTAQVLNINSLDNTQWNEALLQFKEYNIFQSYEWGELKKSEGWEPLRITVSDNDCMELTLIAQIVMKKVFGINIAWCPGGPLIITENRDKVDNALKKLKDIVTEYNLANLRCKTFMEDNDINNKFFIKFKKPTSTLTSRKTNIIKMMPSDDFLSQIRKKHRYYIKQSLKNNIDWRIMENDEAGSEFSSIHKQMQQEKNLNLPIIDIALFARLLDSSNTHKIITLAGYKDGECISACLVSLFHRKAFYHYAASTDSGRNLNASYGMIFELMNYLNSLEIDILDFGGLSEDQSSSGVDFFKEGFNGKEIKRVGEFDIAKSILHSYIFNKALDFKKNK